MARTKTVDCGKCGHVFERDPCLEVPCPGCAKPVGQNCQRPSGHQPWSGWGRFHDARDLLAARCGAYHHDCKEPDPESCGICHP